MQIWREISLINQIITPENNVKVKKLRINNVNF